MIRLRKIIWAVIAFCLIVNYPKTGNSEQIKFGPKEASVLIDRLLGFSGKSLNNREKLSKYKEWANVYTKYNSKEFLDINEMKIYLFIVFVSQEKVLIQTQEDISAEILSKFERQPEVFLRALKELQFLIPATCSALKGHFLFTGELDKRHQFSKKYKEMIFHYLGEDRGKECLSRVTEIPRLP